ncbi:tetratricopeptide repeat protein [Chondromyces apiculatus]|uniref:Tetratricopeptide repeat protein n=1 Tax=Chondromyces apiculatus DSM 436 TaxID=1192034 RepID=A0A017SV74_9BACT|nr:tetratricopeptide repeat protein [Chondromyces apiculatus]EYF00893.1 Hypothetical protein CAP_8910 [Chondromyces apiculatus DSM 436]
MQDPKIGRASLRIENLATALEQGVDNEAAVLEVLVAALVKGNPQPELWDKLHSATARDDRFSELAQAYEKVASDRRFSTYGPPVQAEVLMRAASFFTTILGDPAGARGYLERVVTVAPGRVDAFSKLEALLLEAREDVRLADLYAQAAPHRAERDEQLGMLRQALKLLEAWPDEEERATRILQQLTKLDPADTWARHALEERLTKAGKVADVTRMLEQVLTTEPGPEEGEALAIRARLIGLYTAEQADPKDVEKALPHVEEVLARDPGHAVAIATAEALLARKPVAPRAAAALEVPYERVGRTKDAMKMLSMQIEALRGPKRIEAQKRMMELLLNRVGDLPGAFALCEQILTVEPGDDRVRERYLSLAASLDKRQEAAKLFGRAAATARDKGARARIAVELGELLLELGDVRKARTSFQLAIDAAADDGASLRAARALAQLYEKERDTRGLAAMLGRLADLTPDVEEREQAAERLVRFYEEELKDPAGAIGAYRKLFGTRREAWALEALSRHYEGSAAHAELAEVLERQADLNLDREAARVQMLRAAELRTEQLGDKPAAIESWRRMLTAFGPSREVHARLLPLLEQERRWDELTKVLDADAELTVGSERAALLARIGALRASRLHDPMGALQAYRQALAIEPTEKTSRLSVERMLGNPDPNAARTSQAPPPPDAQRLAACGVLEPIARAEGNASLLLRVLEVKGDLAEAAAVMPGDAEGASATDLPSWGEADAASDSAPGSVHEAITRPPPVGWVEAPEERPRTLRPAAPPRDLMKLATETIEPETRRAPLSAETVALRLSAIEEAVGIAERDLRDGKRALGLAARGLALATSMLPARLAFWAAEVERLTEGPGEGARRAAVLAEALGDRPVNSPELIHLAQRTGEALAANGDMGGALAVYRRALAHEPSSAELLGRVDELLREQGSPEERIALYHEALSRPCAPERRRELLHAIGAIQRRDLNDPAAAVATYRAALQEDPEDDGAYEALLATLAEAEAWDALYNELAGRLSRVQDDDVARVHHELRMAEVAGRAGRTDVAAARYKAMLARGAPVGAEALVTIEQLARAQGDAALLRQVLERRVAIAVDPGDEASALEQLAAYLAEAPDGEPRDAPAAAEARRRAAVLAEGPLADPGRALALYEQVLANLPRDRHAAARLLSLYRERGTWEQVPPVCEVLLDTSESATEALVELAMLEEAAVRAGAIDLLLAAAGRVKARFPEMSPEQLRTVEATMARGLGADPARQDEAAAALRSLVSTAPEDDSTALAAFEAFLAASPDSPARHEDRRWLHGVQVERAPEAERVAALAAWAAWEESVMVDREAAASLYERVLALDPNHDGALASRARLLLAIGEVDQAVKLMESRRDRATGEARTALEIALAELLFDRLDRPNDALDVVAPALQSGAPQPAALSLAIRALAHPAAQARAAALLEGAEVAAGDTAARIALLETMLASGPGDSAARSRWFERLLDLHADDPEQALGVALRAASALPGEMSLWERAEQLGRKTKQPERVIDAYGAALDSAAGLASDDIEELGRRGVEYHEEWFDAPETTMRLLRRLVELLPGSVWGFERLKLTYNAAERWDDLFALYDTMLARTEDSAERQFLLEDAATVARDLAGDAERTIRYLEALLDLSDDARTRSSLERLYERHGRHRPLIKLLSEDLPRLAPDAAQRLRERIALLWLDGVGEAEAALPGVEQMLDKDPASKEAFSLLERILDATSVAPESDERREARRRAAELLTSRYRAEERPADLTRVLEIQADGAAPEARRVLLAEIVRLRRDVLGDEAGALDRLAELVELTPADEAPRAELAVLCGRLDRHARHAEVLARAAGHAVDSALAISLLKEAATLRQQRLADADGAIALLRRLFALAEQHAHADEGLAALRDLDRLLDAAGRVVERCEVLDLLAAREEAPGAQREALGELARLSWTVLQDDERAIAAYRARLASDAADLPALDGLADILEKAGRHRELADVLDQRATAHGGGEAARRDLGRVARLFERDLGEPDQAIAIWLRIRTDLGPDVESGEALAALYTGAARWTDLVALLDVEARAAEEAGELARAAALSTQLAGVHRDHTLAWELAVPAYKRAWEAARADGAEAAAHARLAREGLASLLDRIDPARDEHRPSLLAATAALLDIASAEDDWRARVALLEPRLAGATSDTDRVAILHESASLLEGRATDVNGAFDLVWRAFLLAPGHEPPANLLRLSEAAGRWATLADALPSLEARGDTPAPTLRDLWHRVAAWERDARKDLDAAERAFEQALTHEPANSAILVELADLQRQRPGAPLVSTLLRLADATGGDLALYREATVVARDVVGDLARALAIAARLLDLAADRWADGEPSFDTDAPDHPGHAGLWAIDVLIALLLTAGERASVVKLGQRGAAMPFPREVQRRLLRTAADAAELDEAISLYATLFDEEPSDEPGGERLAALLAEAGRREALIQHRERQIAVAEDADRRVALRFDAANLLAEGTEVARAIEALRKNLDEVPGHGPSAEKLAALFAASGNHRDLASLHEEQAALREAASDPSAASLWLKAAELTERELGDPRRAIGSYRRAAALGATEALDALARLLLAQGEPAAAAEALERLCATTTTDRVATETLRLADAYVAAGRADRARSALERSLGRIPVPSTSAPRSLPRSIPPGGTPVPEEDQQPLRERLRALYREAGEWTALAELIAEDAGRLTEPTARLALLRDAADLHLSHGGSPAAAIPLLEEAIALAPDDLGLRLSRGRALAASERIPEADAALRAMLDEFGSRRPKERALVHYERARVLLTAGDRAGAMTELDLALRIDPAHPGALLAAAGLASDDGQLERASRSYRALLLVARRPRPGTDIAVTRSEILVALADIARRQGEPDRETEQMESAFEAAREGDLEHQRLLIALRSRGRHDLLARGIEARLEAQPLEAERVALLDELATLHETHLARPDAALDARLRVLSLRPGSNSAHAAALGAAERLGKPERYVEMLQQLLVQHPGSAELLLHLGRALLLAGDDAGAADAYRRAEATLSPGDPRLDDIWSASEAIAEKLGDTKAQAELLDRRLRAADAADAERGGRAVDTPPEVRAEPRYRLARLHAASPTSAERAAELLEQAIALHPDADRAEPALREILRQDPRQERAARLLERVARAAERPRALVDALMLLASIEEPERAALRLREAVDLARSLKDAPLAESILQRMIEERVPGPAGAASAAWSLAALADLREEASDLATAADLRERAARASSPDEERALLLRVATLAAGPLGDLPRAARLYEELRTREPAEREIWEPLADVYRKSGDAPRLAALLDATAPLLDTVAERSHLRLERARLVATGSPDDAVVLLRELLDEDPSQIEAAILLASLLERSGRLADLRDLYARQIDAAKDRSDVPSILSLSLRLGQLFEQDGDERAALDVYSAASDWDPRSPDVLRAIVRLTRHEDEPLALAEALDRLLKVERGEEAVAVAIQLSGLRAGQGDERGAEEALEAGYATTPGSDRLREELAERYTAREAWHKLASLYTSEAQAEGLTDDARVESLCRAADILRQRAGDAAASADVLTRALAIAPADRDVLLAFIDAAGATGQHGRAAEALTRALDATADDPWLYSARADLHDAQGATDRALADRERAYALDPRAHAAALLVQLERNLTRADVEAAVDLSFDASADLWSDPEPEPEPAAPKPSPARDLRLRLADVLARSGDLDRARDHLTELLRKDGKDREALRTLAAIEESAGSWDAAGAVYRRLIALEDGEPLVTTALHLAEACDKAQRPGDARGGLERALRVAPAHPEVRDRLRRLYEQTGAHRDLAAMLFDDARVTGDAAERYPLLLRAGRLFVEEDDVAPAISALEEARALRPDDQEASLLLSEAFAVSGRRDDARALLGELLAAHKNRRSKQLGAVYQRLARLEMREGNAPEALTALARAFENDPQNGALAMELGSLALNRGEQELATRAYRSVTMMKPAADRPGTEAGTEGATPAARGMAYYQLAAMALAGGDRRKARLMVDKAIEADATLDQARSLLEELKGG